jgi:hypothetical protein
MAILYSKELNYAIWHWLYWNESFQKRFTLPPQRKFPPSSWRVIIVRVLGHPNRVGGKACYDVKQLFTAKIYIVQ